MTGAGPGRWAYDRIGERYTATRGEDPTIAEAVHRALGDARDVLNVGAGTGSYEPRDRPVVAVDPSMVMLAQRPAGAAPAVQAAAEALPFADGAFDAALGVLTVHHWRDPSRGLAEVCRVVRRRVVLLTTDPAVWSRFWLVTDYIPAVGDLDRDWFPTLDELRRALGALRVVPVPVPSDCRDGFTGAYWRRPRAYLDPGVRAGMSTMRRLPDALVRPGLRRLEADLESGEWERRYGHLLELDELDLGYRLVVAEPANRP
jgi:SAM-dependent methyltransferase